MSEVKVPELAESITEATIVKWLKAEGDSVAQGEVLAELETDKVNMELNAEQDGTLTKIMREPGDTVHVGDVVAMIEEGAAPTQKQSAPPKAEAEAAEKQATQPKEEKVEPTPASNDNQRKESVGAGQPHLLRESWQEHKTLTCIT